MLSRDRRMLPPQTSTSQATPSRLLTMESRAPGLVRTSGSTRTERPESFQSRPAPRTAKPPNQNRVEPTSSECGGFRCVAVHAFDATGRRLSLSYTATAIVASAPRCTSPASAGPASGGARLGHRRRARVQTNDQRTVCAIPRRLLERRRRHRARVLMAAFPGSRESATRGSTHSEAAPPAREVWHSHPYADSACEGDLTRARVPTSGIARFGARHQTKDHESRRRSRRNSLGQSRRDNDRELSCEVPSQALQGKHHPLTRELVCLQRHVMRQFPEREGSSALLRRFGHRIQIALRRGHLWSATHTSSSGGAWESNLPSRVACGRATTRACGGDHRFPAWRYAWDRPSSSPDRRRAYEHNGRANHHVVREAPQRQPQTS